MAGTPAWLLRLLPLLLFLLPPGLRLREELSAVTTNRRRPENNAASAAAAAGELLLHPIVLVSGVICSEMEARLTEAYRPSVPRCGAMKGKGWFGLLTINSTDFVECFAEQMSLVYDPIANDYRNQPGVETRVANFGSSRGFQTNPNHPEWCLRVLRQELQRIGYRDGDTLFGAPYDIRHAPPAPGQPSEVFSGYFRQLKRLIEERRRGQKVILLGHSFGGMVALDFLRATPMAWRDKHIKHLLLVAPLPSAQGFVEQVRAFASGSERLDPQLELIEPSSPPLALPLARALRPMWRTLESSKVGFPSPAVFGRRPLVLTERRNYSAYDMEGLLAAVGAAAAVEPFMRREVPKMTSSFQAPMVPTTCINGAGIDTPEQLVYWDGNFDDKDPEIVYGDGDNTINLISMLAFDEKMRRWPVQRKLYKSIKLQGADHSTIVTADWALKRIMQEILEANRI